MISGVNSENVIWGVDVTRKGDTANKAPGGQARQASVYVISKRRRYRPLPPGEPVPSVPPIEKPMGPPLRYGGFGDDTHASLKSHI